MVPEADLGAQKFFRAVGWRAVEVVPDHFDLGEDGYRFEKPVDQG